MAKVNGKGCIYQVDKGKDGKKPKARCRTWRLVVSLGKDPRTGRYRQKAKAFHGTFTQAQNAMREFISEIESDEPAHHASLTFKEYSMHYVDKREAMGEIQERTAAHLRYALKALGHLIGSLRLQEVAPRDVEGAFMRLRAGDTLSGRPLSERTLYNIHLAAHLMFERAGEEGLVSANPLDKVPKPRKESMERKSLSPREYSALLRSLDPADPMQCAVLLCAELGLRRSEALGLSWGDVDFDASTVNVHASCDDHGELKSTKTEAGSRLLPLPQHLASALMRRKRTVVTRMLGTFLGEHVIQLPRDGEGVIQPSREGERSAGCIEIDGRFFDLDPKLAITCDEKGERPLPNALSHWWMRHRTRFGLDGYTLHGLRHSFLSLAAAQGVHPSVMMRLAGHNNPGITMKIYTHVNIELERKAIEVMQAAYVGECQSAKNEQSAVGTDTRNAHDS